MNNEPAAGGVFHGWRIVGYLVCTQVLTIGFLFYGIGVLMDPIAQSFGLTRGETAYGFSLFTFGVAGWSPILGSWVRRRGPREPLLIGVVALATALLTLGVVRAPWAYYGIMGIWASFGVSAAAGVPAQAIIVNWFRRSRGMALSITSAGISLGGLVLAPLTAWLIPRYGWSTAILVPAVLLLIALPVGARLLRNQPEDMGLFQDGEPYQLPETAPPADLPFRALLADRKFQIVAVSYALGLSAMTSIMVNLVNYWKDLGLSTERATLAFALLAGVGMFGKPFFGRLADRVSAKAGGMLSFALLFAGALVLVVWQSPWNAVPFIFLFGLGIGGAHPMQSAINGSLYGREHFSRVAGVLMPWIVSIQGIFYGVSGFLHDRFHAYVPVFAVLGSLFVVSLLLLTRLELPEDPDLITTPSKEQLGPA